MSRDLDPAHRIMPLSEQRLPEGPAPEMVERVARAIYERACERNKHHLPESDLAPWSDQAEAIRVEYRYLARAAIEIAADLETRR